MRARKQGIHVLSIICLFFAGLLALVSCATATPPGSDENFEAADEETSGTVRLLLPELSDEFTQLHGESADTIFPISNYRISFSNSDGEDITEAELMSSSFVRNEMREGSWNYSIEAHDILGTVVGTAVGVIEVVSGQPNTKQIVLQSSELDRNFGLLLSWPEGLLLSPRVEIEIRRQNEGELVVFKSADAKVFAPSTAVWAAELPPGQYVVLTKLYDGETTRASSLESIQVTKGRVALFEEILTADEINVAPQSVESIMVDAIADDALLLTWEDNSVNEDGFRVKGVCT